MRSIFIASICIVLFLGCKPKGPDIKLSVEGIIYDADAPTALINGEMRALGEVVNNFTIIEIGREYVKFKNQDKIITRELVVTDEDVLRSEKAAKKRIKKRIKKREK